MKRSTLEILSTEELWALHDRVTATLTARINAEKKVLEDRLAKLNGRPPVAQIGETPKRRSYPTVFPKFRNPEQPWETWAGRGKKPRSEEHTSELQSRVDLVCRLLLEKKKKKKNNDNK